LGLDLMMAFGGAGLAIVCFNEVRRLRRLSRGFPAVCFGLGAGLFAAAAPGGARLVWSVIDGFIL